MCSGVSAFDSTDIYPFNRSWVPEHLFSISYTNESVTYNSMSKYVSGFVPSTSITNSQNVLPILADGSLSNLSTIISPDPSSEEITASRTWIKSVLYHKIHIFPTKEASNIEEKRKKQGGNKVKEERNRKCEQFQ